MGPNELVQVAAIARRYHLGGRTKTEIATEFGLTRFKVARILDEARAAGIVEVTIRLPASLDAELSTQLRERYGLRRALVVTSPDDGEEALRENLAKAAADMLTEIVIDEDVLGIGWGRTLNSVADSLTSLAPCPVVQMTGMVGSIAANSTELVRRITAVSGGPAFPIYAPLLLPDEVTASGVRRQPEIAAAIAQFGSITKALVAVGSWNPPNSQLRNAVPPRQRADLEDLGVRAEICATLIADDGHAIDNDLAGRAISPTSAELREIPEVIVLAGGASKAQAIRAVLAGGWAHSLITEAGVARTLLSG